MDIMVSIVIMIISERIFTVMKYVKIQEQQHWWPQPHLQAVWDSQCDDCRHTKVRQENDEEGEADGEGYGTRWVKGFLTYGDNKSTISLNKAEGRSCYIYSYI